MDVKSEADTTRPEELCYGVCRSCGMRICRPYNVAQTGMKSAVVCDDCWMSAALAYERKETSQSEIARQLGINRASVREKFIHFGLLDDYAYLVQRRRKSKRFRTHYPERAAAATTAWNNTERGREQLQSAAYKAYHREYEQRPEVRARRKEQYNAPQYSERKTTKRVLLSNEQRRERRKASDRSYYQRKLCTKEGRERNRIRAREGMRRLSARRKQERLEFANSGDNTT